MTSLHSRRALLGMGVLALFFAVVVVLLWQSSLPGMQPGHEESREKHHGRVPCDPPNPQDPITGGQGYCYKHRMGTWAGDAQNFPTCQAGPNSWVCNSPGAACSDAMTANGHCMLTGSGQNCNCQCR
jgi:hypothetical protein